MAAPRKNHRRFSFSLITDYCFTDYFPLLPQRIGRRQVIITIAPAGSQSEALIGLRLKGQRTQYVVALSSLYQVAALWHGNKESAAKRAARKAGIPWRTACKQFIAQNSL